MRFMKTPILLLVVMLLTAGCSLYQNTTPTPATAVPQETQTPAPIVTPAPVQTDEDILLVYEVPAYGFSFDYPSAWALEEVQPDASRLNKALVLKMNTIRLEIEYGFLFEINGIRQPEVLSGEWVEQEPTNFFGESLPQSGLVEEDRIKMLVFPSPENIFVVDDLFFRVSVQETGPLAQNEIDLPEALLEQIHAILASFTTIERSGSPADPYPGWQVYVNLDHGFLMRYPPEWAAEERQVEAAPAVMADAVILTRDNANLMLVYHFTENYLPIQSQILGGLLVDEGQIRFLGAEIPKLTLVYAEKEKGVLYNGLEPYQAERLTFHISLLDNRAGIGYDLLEVPDPVQQEAEAILGSVRQFPALLVPLQEAVKSEGREIFLTFESCFDLDEGLQVGLEDPGCDFRISKPASGGDVRIAFQPAAPAAFGFDGVFAEQPEAAECAGLAGYSSTAETIAPLDSGHICYQTNAGRYGYLIFRALTSDGVSFDWQTFTTAGPLGYTGGGENAAITMKDITVPDGTVFDPGESFDKTWQLMNTGTTTWTTGYAIRFKDGERMDAPFEVALPKQVAPGGTVNITVPMVAPGEPGEYTSHWVLRDEQGRPFGVGKGGDETFWAEIVVEGVETPEEEEEPQVEETPAVETTLAVEPVSFNGACPASIDVSFSISTEGMDHYTYELAAGAAQEGFEFFLPDPKEVQLGGSGPNTKTVSYTITMQNPVEAWLQILVTGPVEYSSAKVYFTVECE